MNTALYKQMLKRNSRPFASFSLGSSFYLLLVIALYPSIASTKSMDELLKQMPAGFSKAFGLEGGLSTLSDFIAADYYGVLMIVILAVFSLTTAMQLVVKLVDQGSMAYLLATPHSRGTIIRTQALVLVTGLGAIMGTMTVAGIAGGYLLVDDVSFDAWSFIKMNIAAFFLFFVLGAFSFFISCVTNDAKKAIGIAAVVTILSYAFDLAGKLSDNVAWMRSLSLFSLFDPVAIAKGTEPILLTCLLLCGIGAVFYVLAVLLFSKRDLPL
ncbi:ABC transporter permease [Priestia koreensis]|uniref:ABC-2 type transport system permease protein n=1 Tax=Priestia koreensis TaxID=284581 RepID=A0A0M0L944_9BACI|nr:ABC transporter permease subunit [Priestia koreensis]KOO47600.1 hypothetical protein AMD01_06070 [Priestia koreensis]